MLFADRTSCQDFLANEFRLLLSSFAYVLIETLRREHLAGTDLAQAQVDTIRLKLFKVAARVTTSVRRVVLHLSSSYPGQELFRRVAASLLDSCYDNAFMESFFGTLRMELEMTDYEHMTEADTTIRDYICYYNTHRKHSGLGCLTPVQFELNCQRTK